LHENDKVVAKDSMSASVLGIALPWNTLTWQAELSLVQQVSQLSPASQTVFRVAPVSTASWSSKKATGYSDRAMLLTSV
jgi:hypothetical protein